MNQFSQTHTPSLTRLLSRKGASRLTRPFICLPMAVIAAARFDEDDAFLIRLRVRIPLVGS